MFIVSVLRSFYLIYKKIGSFRIYGSVFDTLCAIIQTVGFSSMCKGLERITVQVCVLLENLRFSCSNRIYCVEFRIRVVNKID